MYRGKRICNTLKEVRKQIADANDIPYEITECTHQGNCLGTCPKCEQELRYIEDQLSLRRAAGVAVSVVGVSLSAMGVYAAPAQPQPLPQEATEQTQLNGKYQFRGKLVDAADRDSTGIIGATIAIKGTKQGVISDLDGNFCIATDTLPAELGISYVGYNHLTIQLTESTLPDLGVIALEEDEDALAGEVIIVGAIQKKSMLERILPPKQYVDVEVYNEEGEPIENFVIKSRKGRVDDYGIWIRRGGHFTVEAPGYKKKRVTAKETEMEVVLKRK